MSNGCAKKLDETHVQNRTGRVADRRGHGRGRLGLDSVALRPAGRDGHRRRARIPVAIVFGAGIRADGRLSPMLADRMDTAIALYRPAKCASCWSAATTASSDYDEPGRMYDYAVARGVPPADVVRDYAGRRTYDTCYRAKAIFGVERAILVTQRFHLPRAHLHLPQPGRGCHRLFRRPPPLLVEQLLPLPRRLRHPARLVGCEDRPPAAGAGPREDMGWKPEARNWKLER